MIDVKTTILLVFLVLFEGILCAGRSDVTSISPTLNSTTLGEIMLPDEQPTTKSCRKCEETKPADAFTLKKDGKLHSYCKACNAKAARGWAAANPERVRQSVERWASQNRDRIQDYKREHYANNRIRYKEARREYYLEHAEELKRYSKEWAAANPERVAENGRKLYGKDLEKSKADRRRWYENNQLAHRVHGQTRRAREKAGGTFSKSDIENLLRVQREQCANCKCSLSVGFHIDHVNPLARGGTNTADNLQLLCGPCNRRKSAKDPYEWARENGRLFV